MDILVADVKNGGCGDEHGHRVTGNMQKCHYEPYRGSGKAKLVQYLLCTTSLRGSARGAWVYGVGPRRVGGHQRLAAANGEVFAEAHSPLVEWKH